MLVNARKLWEFFGQHEELRAKYFVQVINTILGNSRPSVNVLLDVGSGSGQLTRYLTHYFKPKEIVCIERSVDSLKYMLETPDWSNAIHAVQADGQNLPIANDAADLVTAFSVIEYMVHQERFIDEIQRTLSERGVIILQFPNVYTLVELHTGILLPFLFPEAMKDAIVRKRLNWKMFNIRNLSAKHMEKCLNIRNMIFVKQKLVPPEEIIPPMFRPLYGAIKTLLKTVFPLGYLFIAMKKGQKHKLEM